MGSHNWLHAATACPQQRRPWTMPSTRSRIVAHHLLSVTVCPRWSHGSSSVNLDGSRSSRADVLVVVEDIVGVVRGLHVYQPVVDGVAVRLANPFGCFVAAEEIDVDAFAETAEGGEEPPRPGGVPIAEV